MFESLESPRDQGLSHKYALLMYTVYFFLGVSGVLVGILRHKTVGIAPFSVVAVLAGFWFVRTRSDLETRPQRIHGWRMMALLILTLIPTFVNDLLH